MNDLLDLPPIEAAALALPEPAPAQALDLRKINLTDVALAQYGDWQKDVAATKANLSTLVLDLSTAAKVKEARTLRHRLIGEPLAAVRKVAAGIKSAMATTSKAVGAELEKIEAAYTEADALILPKIEAREAELEAERAEKARLEAERVEKLQAGIATIRSYVQKAAGLPAERIARGIAGLEAMTFAPEQWQEFAGTAVVARDESLAALRLMHAAAVQAEADRAERERMEAALAVLQAQEAERKRIADETASLVASIRAESRRVEWPKNPAYIRKAMGTFECMAPDWENDPREAVREAIAEGRRYLAGLMAVATEAAAQNLTNATVTTPDGTVADAATGEVLDPIRPDEPDAAPAPTLDDMGGEKPDVQDAVGMAEVNLQPGNVAALPPADEPAVKLGDLNTRLGFTMTEAFVRDTLRITPRRDGRAVLVAESALPDLADKLVERIREVLG